MEDDFDTGGEVVCPGCSASMDGFELYTHNAGSGDEGTSRCLYCGERFDDEEFISAG